MAATTIARSAGNAQLGLPSTLLPVSLAVLVTDGSGNPVAGVTVTWQVGTGAGTLTSPTAVTGANGIATNGWTLGPATGQQIVTADVAGLAGTPIVFTAQCVLVTPADITAYYRIQTTAEVVNGLIAELISEAEGEIEGNSGKCLTIKPVTWYDDATTLRIGEGVSNLILKYVPVDPASIVVKNYMGVTIDPSTYTVRLDKGLIVGLPANGPGAFFAGPWSLFNQGPYTIAANAGWGTSPDYATIWLPLIRRAVIDYVGYLFQQRDIGASALKAAGTSVTYAIDPITGVPDRVARAIRKLRGPVVTGQ